MSSHLDVYSKYFEKPMSIYSKFRFNCTMCGQCCIHRDDILLNAKDMFNLATKLQMSCKEVVARFGELYIGPKSRVPIVRLRPVGEERRCPFLRPDKLCAVHEKKPTVCALFPLGRFVREDAAVGDEIGFDAVSYLCNDVKCDKSRTHTVQEWLIRSNVPVEDEFFVKWSALLSVLVRVMRSAKAEDDAFREASVRLSELLYLGYDTTREFLPQFLARIPQIDGLLKVLPWATSGGEA